MYISGYIAKMLLATKDDKTKFFISNKIAKTKFYGIAM